jgi:hypothetical protein
VVIFGIYLTVARLVNGKLCKISSALWSSLISAYACASARLICNPKVHYLFVKIVTGSSPEPDEFNPRPEISVFLRFVLMLSFLHLSFGNGLFPWGSRTELYFVRIFLSELG